MYDSGGILWRHDQPGAQWSHWVVSGSALLLSVLMHYLVIERLPELPVGETPDLGSYTRSRPVALQDIRRDTGKLFDRPDPFRAEDPAHAVDLSREAEVFAEAVDPVFAAPERPVDDVLSGRDQATLRPVAPDAREAWEPRQDILKIEEQRAAEDARAPPRRYTAPVPRIPDAPAIQVPDIAPPDALRIARAAGPPRSASGFRTGTPQRPAIPEGPLLPEPVLALDGEGEEDEGPPLLDEVDAMDEPEKEAAPFEPVEQVLDMTMRTFRPDDEPGYTYFQLDITRKGQSELPVLGRDVLVLQDCSESMTQRKLENCKEGIHHVLDQLNPQDRFEVLTFREGTERCFGAFAPADSRARAKANLFIESMDARGKTDVYASLEALMTMPRQSDRPFIAILVTDGRPTAGQVDSSDIIETFTRNNQGNVSVFGLGGGKRVNRFLLDLLSYRNRGDSRVEEDRKDIPEALQGMARELRRPVLVDLRQRFTGVEGTETYPSTLTHLYLDRPLTIYGRFEGEAPRAAFQVIGTSDDGEKDMVFSLDWGQAGSGASSIRTQWAWHKIYHLIGTYIETRQPEVLNRMHAVADRYNLPVPYGRDVIYR